LSTETWELHQLYQHKLTGGQQGDCEHRKYWDSQKDPGSVLICASSAAFPMFHCQVATKLIKPRTGRVMAAVARSGTAIT